jgi:hypothetical protein
MENVDRLPGDKRWLLATLATIQDYCEDQGRVW